MELSIINEEKTNDKEVTTGNHQNNVNLNIILESSNMIAENSQSQIQNDNLHKQLQNQTIQNYQNQSQQLKECRNVATNQYINNNQNSGDQIEIDSQNVHSNPISLRQVKNQQKITQFFQPKIPNKQQNVLQPISLPTIIQNNAIIDNIGAQKLKNISLQNYKKQDNSNQMVIEDCLPKEQKEKLFIQHENRKLQQQLAQLTQELFQKDKQIEEKQSKIDQVLIEKDRAQNQIQNAQMQFQQFQMIAKQKLCSLLLQEEQLKRNQKKNELLHLKQRIGEVVTLRDGTRFEDRWVDGYEIKNVKEKICKLKYDLENLQNTLTQINDSIQNQGKKLKQKKSVQQQPNQQLIDQFLTTPKLSPHNTIQDSNQNFNISDHSHSQQFSNSSIVDSLYSQKERICFQTSILQKDLQINEEMLQKLEHEKKLAFQQYKKMNEEENCRFAYSGGQYLPWPLIKDRYQFLSLIGKGGFSEVYKAYDLQLMVEVACKVHQLNVNWSEDCKRNYIIHTLRENKIHNQLNHPNIVRQYDSVELDQNSFFTVLEFCEGPDLSTYLKINQSLPEKEARNIIRQIIQGIKYLHEQPKKIVHYDLKPHNIIFKRGEIKISDFGLSKEMDENVTRFELTNQGVGTYWYLPPECFIQGVNPPKINEKVDVWSIGVMFYEMIYGQKPFGDNLSQEKLYKENVILRANYVNFPTISRPISTECQNFIRKCLAYNMDDRWTIQDASNSPYMDQNFKKMIVAQGNQQNLAIENYMQTKNQQFLSKQ